MFCDSELLHIWEKFWWSESSEIVVWNIWGSVVLSFCTSERNSGCLKVLRCLPIFWNQNFQKISELQNSFSDFWFFFQKFRNSDSVSDIFRSSDFLSSCWWAYGLHGKWQAQVAAGWWDSAWQGFWELKKMQATGQRATRLLPVSAYLCWHCHQPSWLCDGCDAICCLSEWARQGEIAINMFVMACFNVPGKCVLDEEMDPITKKGSQGLGPDHVSVWDVDVHLRVRGPCDKRDLMERIFLSDIPARKMCCLSSSGWNQTTYGVLLLLNHCRHWPPSVKKVTSLTAWTWP